jgi:hypothetical protein
VRMCIGVRMCAGVCMCEWGVHAMCGGICMCIDHLNIARVRVRSPN